MSHTFNIKDLFSLSSLIKAHLTIKTKFNEIPSRDWKHHFSDLMEFVEDEADRLIVEEMTVNVYTSHEQNIPIVFSEHQYSISNDDKRDWSKAFMIVYHLLSQYECHPRSSK